MYHEPVLLNESIEGLSVKADGTYVDVTYGGGGHSAEILKRLKKGRLIAFEQDEEAINQISSFEFRVSGLKKAENKSGEMGVGSWKWIEKNKVLFLNYNFRYINNFLNYYGINKVDGIIADLGISSHQIDTAERGFSTRFEGKLDMRMNKNRKLNARIIVNEYTEEELKRIFKMYGEIENTSELVKEIVNSRDKKPIETTEELKNAIKRVGNRHAISGRYGMSEKNDIKYYSKVFQAIRIEVNDEIESLKEMLLQTIELIEKGGRLVVISYHSLEDRLVKNFIKAGNFEGEIKKDFYGNPILPFKQIIKKAIIPTEEEIRINNRARSAKLRIAEKI